MDLQLADKVAFITGASGGIGRALAEAFAGEGARVVLGGHGHFDELVGWLEQQPWRERALAVRADVRQPDQLATGFAEARSHFGRVDVAVANAGVWPIPDQRLDEMPEQRLRDTLETNLLGALWTARAFMASLAISGPREDEHGASLIFTGSTAGRFGERGHVDYAASKAALTGVVTTLKNEIVALDPRARVNMIEPGWTVTHMARPALAVPGAVEKAVSTMALRQLGRARDIAMTALWLASPAMARHTTGQVVTVAGGMEGRLLWQPDELDGDEIRRRVRAP